MDLVPGADEFLVGAPSYAGEEIFGSTKRRLDAEPGGENDSHRYDKVNFSQPKSMRTRQQGSPSTPIRLDDEDDINEPGPLVHESPPNFPEPLQHVTNVLEEDCAENMCIYGGYLLLENGLALPCCQTQTRNAIVNFLMVYLLQHIMASSTSAGRTKIMRNSFFSV